MTSTWEAARERGRVRAIAALRRDIARKYAYCSDELIDHLIEEDSRWREEYEAIMAPEFVPPRPGRRMPRPWKIALYWHQRGRPLAEYISVPYCFRCDCMFRFDPDLSPEDRWNASACERAHLVDRIRGGLDGPQNLMPLCHRCHKIMPSFIAGEGPDAIAWVMRAGRPRLRIVHDGDLRKYVHLIAEAEGAVRLIGERAADSPHFIPGMKPPNTMAAYTVARRR
jgi:hypothetical protein